MKIRLKQAVRDQKAHALAKEYLLQLNIKGVTPELLEKYLHLLERKPRPDSVAEIYKRILQSAQNANMRAGVIGAAIGGVERLAKSVATNQSSSHMLEAGCRYEN